MRGVRLHRQRQGRQGRIEKRNVLDREARAAVGGDPIALRVAAHTLKSSSANVGARTLSDAARELEHGARDGTLDKPEALVARIVTEFAQVKRALLEKAPLAR